MATPATRLITLLMLLQRQPNQKAPDLAEKLGISVRSLHRYINMLDDMGIPVYSERGPYGGFSLVRGYHMPVLVIHGANDLQPETASRVNANLFPNAEFRVIPNAGHFHSTISPRHSRLSRANS
jgi:pimeloyl-ACP methyl ester carboxylesterase